MAFPYKILNEMSTKLKILEAENARLRTCCNQTQLNSVHSRDSDGYEYHQTSTPVDFNRYDQTLPISVHQAVQTKPADFVLQSEVERLKKVVADLVYRNNRYHFRLSNCTCCLSDDADHDVSPASFDESIRASTSLDLNLPSSTPPPLLTTVPVLGKMMSTTQERG